MAERVAVIGAGVIGAAVAWHLARRGVEVTVLEAGAPGEAASGRSYGWINASFSLNEAHFRLRIEAIAAWHRLQAELPDLPVVWPGCVCWDEPPDEMARMAERFRAADYPVEFWDRARVMAELPAVAAPDLALFLPAEGAAEAGAVARHLLAAGDVQVVSGCPVAGIETGGGRVTGLRVPGGVVPADRVVVAAGAATDSLLAPLGVDLPMLYRPTATMRTAPVPPCLPRLAVAPGLEFRQLATGEILAPVSPNHQADDAEALRETPPALAEEALARLRALMPGQDLRWRTAEFAVRPMPGDGLPAVGPAGPEGLYVAVMHSGVTLGALMGDLVAAEIAGNGSDWLTPYRPGRFAGAGQVGSSS